MATKKSPPSAGLPDRYAALQRAQMAFDALEEGQKTADSRDRPVTREVAALVPTPIAVPVDSAQKVPGLTHSQSGRPPAVDVRSLQSSVASSIRVTPSGAGFDRLKMGHERLGRPTSRVSSGASTDGPKGPQDGSGTDVAIRSKVLGRDELEDIYRQSRLEHTLSLLERVGAHFQCTPGELASERRRLSKLTSTELDAVTRGYEHASNQVLILTSESHAQKAGREGSRSARLFYDQHGTTAAHSDADRPRPSLSTRPRT